MVSKFRKAKKAGKTLQERTAESYKTRDESGKFRSYISPNMPLPKWKCTEGDHEIDVLGFITGKNNPNGIEEGETAYCVNVYVHFKVGMNENAYVCPNLTLGKRCPICELIESLNNTGDEEDEKIAKAMSAKRRVLYNIICYNSEKEERQGVQLWEASYHLAEKQFVSLAKQGKGGGFIEFADPDDGKTIMFERTGVGIKTEYNGVRLVDRDYSIDDELMDKCISIGDYIEIKSYEELAAIVGSSVPEKEEDYEPPTRSRSKREEPEKEEEKSKEEQSSRSRGRRSKEPNEMERDEQQKEEEKKEEEPSRRSRRTEEKKEEEPPAESGTRLKRRSRRNS